MSWLSLIVLSLRIVLALTNFLERRQMIAQAEAKVLKEALDDADTRLAKVRAASDAARVNGLPSDDSSIFRD